MSHFYEGLFDRWTHFYEEFSVMLCTNPKRMLHGMNPWKQFPCSAIVILWQKTLKWVVRVIVVPWQSKHKPLRQPGHYGVGLGRTRNKQLRFVVGGWVGEILTFFWRLGMCNGTHNRDSPSGTFETQTSDIPHQKVSCGLPMAVPLSLAQSQSRPPETP